MRPGQEGPRPIAGCRWCKACNFPATACSYHAVPMRDWETAGDRIAAVKQAIKSAQDGAS